MGNKKQQRKLSGDVQWFSTRQKSSRKRRSPMQLVALRLNDLATLFRSRYRQTTLPDDDAGRDDLAIALNHLACLAHPRGHITRWIGIWAPWLTVAETAEIVQPILANPKRWSADSLAWVLKVTKEERAMLGLTTIGAMGETKSSRTKRRQQRDRQRKANQRRIKGAITRKQYEEQSLARAKPWIVEGISRATWYRRRAIDTIQSRETSPATP
jgi:hypothetical protein